MTFGEAIEEMKNRNAVMREGWNGKNMFIYMHEPDYLFEGPVVVMKTAQGTHQLGWLASQADIFASDWQLYKHENS